MLFNMFKTFFKIGAFTFGGGYAMLPMIQKEVVEKNEWVETEEFMDILAIAEVTPGPVAINTSSYVGFKVAGFKGAVICTLGTVLPSFLIILFIAMFFGHYKDNAIIEKMFLGIRPAVVALILSAVYKLRVGIKFTVPIVVVALSTIAIILIFDISPVFVILGAACGAIAYGKYKESKL
ncbi:MAG TPA: chromate transporter [Tissierellales bacterium]|nr:chromate transporter [Tissierellales bacterium]